MQGSSSAKELVKPRPTTDPDPPLLQHGPSTRALLLAGAGWGFHAAALLSLVLCRPLVQRNIRMSSKVLGVLGAAAFMGSTGGAALSGLLTDAYGRKCALVVFTGVSLLGLYGASRALGHVHLIIGHVLVGIGAGGEVPSAAVLLYELAPRSSDGARSVALLGVFTALGGVAGIALSLVVAPQIGWRELYRVGSIAGAVFLAVMMWWLPESSRWQQTRRGPCCDFHLKAKVETELPVLDPERSKLLRTENNKQLVRDQIQSANRDCLLATAASRARVKTLALNSALWAALSMSTYVFTVYVPTLLSLQAFSVFETCLPLIMARIAEALGAAIGAVVMARRGFKRTLLVFVTLTVASAVLLVVSVLLATSTTRADKSWKSAAPLMLTMGTAIMAMLASGSWSCALAGIGGQFSVSWRGRGVGLVFALTSAADSVGSYLYPHLFNNLRLSPLAITVLFGALAMAATLAVVASLDRFQPAREGLPLLKTPSADSIHSETCDEDEVADSHRQRDAQHPALTRRGERGASASLLNQVLIDDTL